MSTRDDFLEDLERAQRIRGQLQNDLMEKERATNAGESTARWDAKLRGGLQELAIILDSLFRQLQVYSQDPSRSKLAPKEIDRRKALVNELETDLNMIDDRVRQGGKAIKAGVGVNFKRDAGVGETTDTRNMSNKDLRGAQTQMLKQQADIEDALVGTSENLINVAHNMGDELDLQNKLLDDVEVNVDNTQKRMDKATFRMKELIYKSSDSCLMICIVLLIVAIVVILVVL
jgi:hypothetical protein